MHMYFDENKLKCKNIQQKPFDTKTLKLNGFKIL